MTDSALCQQCGIRVTKQEPLCQCVDVLLKRIADQDCLIEKLQAELSALKSGPADEPYFPGHPRGCECHNCGIVRLEEEEGS
jgi:hypothetical protein